MRWGVLRHWVSGTTDWITLAIMLASEISAEVFSITPGPQLFIQTLSTT